MLKWACSMIMKLSGWKFINTIPDDVRSFVFIGAPHTSNHDFVPAMGVAYNIHRNAKFVIKSTVLVFPLNLFLIPMGAVGIDRSKFKSGGHNNYVQLMADLFKEFKELVLMISPEATRSPNDKWKTGFYYVAKEAGVPIVLGYADYAKKEYGVSKIIYPTEFEKDMHEITEFYRHIQGKRPENFKLDSRFS